MLFPQFGLLLLQRLAFRLLLCQGLAELLFLLCCSRLRLSELQSQPCHLLCLLRVCRLLQSLAGLFCFFLGLLHQPKALQRHLFLGLFAPRRLQCPALLRLGGCSRAVTRGLLLLGLEPGLLRLQGLPLGLLLPGRLLAEPLCLLGLASLLLNLCLQPGSLCRGQSLRFSLCGQPGLLLHPHGCLPRTLLLRELSHSRLLFCSSGPRLLLCQLGPRPRLFGRLPLLP
mmetsp:Transcript_147434/g.367569  ORF Transcript_147434/g.367569 Transcript_147434/m.367569 type:complete len:227 (+) Transcript_147434:544-1224(+)